MKNRDNISSSANKLFQYLLPILGLAGISIPLIVGKSNLSLLGIYLAIPMILAPIIYVKQRKYETNFETFDKKLFSLFLSFYLILVSISVYLLHKSDVRSSAYYLIIAITCGLILLEILLFDMSEKQIIIILIQMAILVLDIIWGVTLKYNLFIGNTDLLSHLWLVRNLINNAHLTEIFGVYEAFPLWHILCTFVNIIIGIPVPTQKIMFITNGFIYSFAPIFTYLIITRLFKDQKIALISALFILINPDVIFYGMYSIPRSVESFLELVLLLVLLDSKNSKKIFLSIILILSMIMYHTASMPFIISILLIIFIFEKIYNQKNYGFICSISFITLTITMTIFYWIFYGEMLFNYLVQHISISASSGVLTKSIVFTPLNELFNYLQYSPLLLFIIVGFFVALNSNKISTLGKIFCIVGFFAVGVTFPGPSLLLNKLANNFNLNRFGEYTFLFIGLTGAIGFYEIYQKSKNHAKIFAIILFIVMSFLSVSNDFTASDNPLVKRPSYTSYLTYEEETAFGHIASISRGYVMSDFVTDNYLSSSKYANNTHILEVDSKGIKVLKNQTEDIFLIRKSELAKRPLKLCSLSSEKFILGYTAFDFNYYNYSDILWDDLIKYNKIYDSNSISGFN